MPTTASISRTHLQCQRGARTPHIRGRGRETGDLHPWKFRAGELHSAFGDRHARPCPAQSARGDGGAYRDRTDDLKLAKLALSQLS